MAVCVVLGLGLPHGALYAQKDALAQSADPRANAANLPLAGIWQGEDLEFIGGATPDEHAALSRDCRWVVLGGTIQFKWQDMTIYSADFKADLTSMPHGIEFRPTDPAKDSPATLLGVYQRDPYSLEVCTAEPADSRPGFIRAGIVARPVDDAAEVRAGLIGYSRLRRVDRSFEAEELQGKWVLEHMEAGGEDSPIDDQGRQGARFNNLAYTLIHVQDGNVLEIPGTFTLEPSRPGQFMEMQPAGGGQSFSCLYEIQGDTLRLVMAAPGSARPTEFKTQPGQMHASFVFRRAKPAGTTAVRAAPP
jgi:uncharacterized protein (TIGR03067 family)